MSNGNIFYETDSIVAIITYKTSNSKTGDEYQTWFIDKNNPPTIAIDTGTDSLICGDCKHRGRVVSLSMAELIAETLPTPKKKALLKRIADKKSKGLTSINIDRKCYVKVFQAPLSVYKTYKNNGYEKITIKQLSKKMKYKTIRIGSYGEGTLVSIEDWKQILKNSIGHTGYTHQWHNPLMNEFKSILMASVDTEEEKRQANELGFRTFRTRKENEPLLSDEISCLSDKKYRKDKPLIPCVDCLLCCGNSRKKKNISVIVH